MKIAIVDYGMGNIRSICSTLNYLGVGEVVLTSDFEELNISDKIILPGVGSFGEAMRKIKEKNIDTILKKIVLNDKKPILGICLGMQLLCNTSTEDGFNKGLSFINAEVNKFDTLGLKIPHIGFNQVKKCEKSILLNNLDLVSDFYFVHSYQVTSNDKIHQSLCTYGKKFIASFEFENIFGTQFHPELSQSNGLKLLKNFIDH